MKIEIRDESFSHLEAYASIPIAFEVRSVFDLSERDGGLGGFELVERPLDRSFVKDYDAVPGNHARDWPARFDTSEWGLLSAWVDGRRVGGAAIAFDSPGVAMLEGRRDLAVLWDLRVAPDHRRQGVGEALFAAVSRWAVDRGCEQLEVETQNVNVPACRFYARQGCVLGAIKRFAYPDLPDEIQLLWYRQLAVVGRQRSSVDGSFRPLAT